MDDDEDDDDDGSRSSQIPNQPPRQQSGKHIVPLWSSFARSFLSPPTPA